MSPEEILLNVLDLLKECGIPFMITGSFASNAHGIPRVTQGADLVIDTDQAQLLDFIGRLGEEFYADSEAAREAFRGNRMINIIHMATGFKIDLILRKPRAFSRVEFARRQKIKFLDQMRWLATPEDTILAKLEWSKMGQSERQYEDALNVASIQGTTLDRKYLGKWALESGIEELVQRLLSELE